MKTVDVLLTNANVQETVNAAINPVKEVRNVNPGNTAKQVTIRILGASRRVKKNK